MSEKNDGGPAFPVEVEAHGEGKQTGPVSGMATGLSVRDWFAGQALIGLLFDTNNRAMGVDHAEAAYDIADAMLAERHKSD